MMKPALEQLVHIPVDGTHIEGMLQLPANPQGIVLFAHGSGSSRHSPRNNFVARELHAQHLGTLLLDLLTVGEDLDYQTRFDISLLTHRLLVATRWVLQHAQTQRLPIGYFGASTGAAAALQAAAAVPELIKAVVSRGGRPDLAGAHDLARVAAPTLLLVGKGLTFDSGGISLKPSLGMEEMKYDMCGGAAVLCAMQAVAQAKLKGLNLVAIVPATENLPGPAALKPGDVITQYGGKNVEVVNTDAEGRLILADALAYGIKKYKPDMVIDVATLTGAVIGRTAVREPAVNAPASLVFTNFTRAILKDARLAQTSLQYARFVDADLRGADLSGCDLLRADFSGADLTGANLTGANLDETNLETARGLDQTIGLDRALNLATARRPTP